MNDYFWLLCAAWCGLTGAVYIRYRLGKSVAAGEFSAEEVASFTRAYALWISCPCVLLWVLQRSEGDSAAPMFLTWPQPQRSLALSVQIFLWSALLWWVFLKDGASTLSRYLRATQRNLGIFNGPAAIRIAAAAAVASGLFAAFFGGRP
ncbi:hypothetical protein [Acidovorax sp. LjRoot194]|uniref:hypothetical protein n=1 Tax=Acidovorax sp. LjRoot194 TaxID=3342280 RepID=UPI003ECE7636